jgi:pSer/pThr/pTyr-binding forkhead associated (FHA) protein
MSIDDAADGGVYVIDKRVVTIGREERDGIDIPIGVETVSAAHAQIEYRDYDFYLSDLGSTNGTYVNHRKEEHQVTGPVRLRNGDVIFFDHHGLRFVMPDQSGWDRTELNQLSGATLISAPPPGSRDSMIDQDGQDEMEPDTDPDEVTGENLDEAELKNLDEVERDYIKQVLRNTEGNKAKAAKIMGISRQALYNKIKRFGISTE